MAGVSERNRAGKMMVYQMMVYQMVSRSIKRKIYISPVQREFGCGMRRAITSARSSFQNNRQISPGEMPTTARCTSPRPHRYTDCAPKRKDLCRTCTIKFLAWEQKNELHPFDEECWAMCIDLLDF